MRIRQLELLIAQLSHRSETDLDQRGRRLRRAGLIPSAGRGPNAPHATPAAAATVLIGAAATALATEVVQGVNEFAPLVPIHKSFCGAKTFAEAVEAALTDYKIAETIRGIELIRFREGNPRSLSVVPLMASITWKEGSDTAIGVYVPEKAVDKMRVGKPEAIGSSMMYPTTVIGGGLIATVAAKIAEEETAPRSGWTGRRT